MKKILLASCCLYSLLGFSTPPSLDSLIKVDNKSNTSCVEYYYYGIDLYCSTKALSHPSVKEIPHERQKIVFDNRLWKAAWAKQTPNITMIEYVVAGDNINHWKELVTSQYFPGLQTKMNLQQFYKFMKQNLEKTGVTLKTKIVINDANSIIWEFQVQAPQHLQQDELQKIVKGKNGFYVLHYVVKQPDMGYKNRERWLHNLKQSQLR